MQTVMQELKRSHDVILVIVQVQVERVGVGSVVGLGPSMVVLNPPPPYPLLLLLLEKELLPARYLLLDWY